REIAPWVSPEVARAVHRALAIDPEERYADAAAMLDAFRPFLDGGFALREEMLAGVLPEVRAAAETSHAPSASLLPKRPWPPVAAGAALALGLGVAAFAL